MPPDDTSREIFAKIDNLKDGFAEMGRDVATLLNEQKHLSQDVGRIERRQVDFERAVESRLATFEKELNHHKRDDETKIKNLISAIQSQPKTESSEEKKKFTVASLMTLEKVIFWLITIILVLLTGKLPKLPFFGG